MPTTPYCSLLLTGLFSILFSCTPNKAEQVGSHVSYTRRTVGPFTVELPSTWEPMDIGATKAGKGKSDIYGFQPSCKETVVFCENIVVRMIAPTPGITLAAMGPMLEEALQENYADYALHSRRDTISRQLPMTVYSYEFTSHNTRLQATTALVQSAGNMAQFTIVTPSKPNVTEANDQLMVQTVIASIQAR